MAVGKNWRPSALQNFSPASAALKTVRSFGERFQARRASQNILIPPVPRTGSNESLEAFDSGLKPIQRQLTLFAHSVDFDVYLCVVQIVNEHLGNETTPPCFPVRISIGYVLPPQSGRSCRSNLAIYLDDNLLEGVFRIGDYPASHDEGRAESREPSRRRLIHRAEHLA